ncbi:MAG: cobalamin biosynthetic protein CobC [Arenicella sp.]|jgi:cobalamin biosynthetic protein CobC
MVNQQVRHGGDLENAITRYGGAVHEWLDLSTGISPWNYPIPQFESSTWRTLPSPETQLIAAASAYYRCLVCDIAVTPGSQLAIRLIPQLLNTALGKKMHAVAIPLIGYQEHANSWQLANHKVIRYRNFDELDTLVSDNLVSDVVVINPNNPSAERLSAAGLEKISSMLSGLLIVDEAFSDLEVDYNQHSSLKPLHHNDNVIVLKSIGKFFGLAGARVGFAVGTHPIVHQLQTLLSPWSVAGPSMEVATLALNDRQWQRSQIKRIKLHAEQQRLAMAVIKQNEPNCRIMDQSLFFSVFGENDRIVGLHEHLARMKIWARLGDPYVDPFVDHSEQLNWLRLSLAGDQLDRLSAALMLFYKTHPNLTTQL